MFPHIPAWLCKRPENPCFPTSNHDTSKFRHALHHSSRCLASCMVMWGLCAAACPWKCVSWSSRCTVCVLMLLPEALWVWHFAVSDATDDFTQILILDISCLGLARYQNFKLQYNTSIKKWYSIPRQKQKKFKAHKIGFFKKRFLELTTCKQCQCWKSHSTQTNYSTHWPACYYIDPFTCIYVRNCHES